MVWGAARWAGQGAGHHFSGLFLRKGPSGHTFLGRYQKPNRAEECQRLRPPPGSWCPWAGAQAGTPQTPLSPELCAIFNTTGRSRANSVGPSPQPCDLHPCVCTLTGQTGGDKAEIRGIVQLPINSFFSPSVGFPASDPRLAAARAENAGAPALPPPLPRPAPTQQGSGFPVRGISSTPGHSTSPGSPATPAVPPRRWASAVWCWSLSPARADQVGVGWTWLELGHCAPAVCFAVAAPSSLALHLLVLSRKSRGGGGDVPAHSRHLASRRPGLLAPHWPDWLPQLPPGLRLASLLHPLQLARVPLKVQDQEGTR